MAQSAEQPPVALHIGKCAFCHEYRDPRSDAKCLVDKNGIPVCHCKFCLSLDCRKALEERKSGMISSGEGCPACREKAGKSEFKAFVQLGTVVMPSDNFKIINLSSTHAKIFFKSINLSGSGSIVKHEVAGFIAGYFDVDPAVALDMVEKKWESWDTTQRGLLRRGFGLLSATDGKLDDKEFEVVRTYLAELVKNAKAPSNKRPRPDGDDASPPHVRQRTEDFQSGMQADLLLRLLKEDSGKGWFTQFDEDKSGSISKTELVDALAATCAGKVSKDAARSIIEGLWCCIDIDNSDAIGSEEFPAFREVLLSNLEKFGA